MKPPSPPPEDLVIYEVKGVPDKPNTPDLKPGFLGFWTEGDYTFFFFDREAEARISAYLADSPDLELRYTHRMKYTDWQDGAGFAPLTVGPLVLAPAWEETAVNPDQCLIKIDPGLAFGFGGHPTTRACLQVLARVYEQDRPLSVLDLGTGTGVLSLAAVRLGAAQVKAVENSQIAYEAARRNVFLNQMDQVIEVIQGRVEEYLDLPGELVCSNLHLPVQEAVLNGGGFAHRRWLILSGLFHAQAEKMEKALLNLGFKTLDRIRDTRWCTLLMKGI
ncbi:MAG: 50S ribosomal protein L11 methyltransferase [Deltaproteobacteria bacterium]|nr:50S ribosomal protein L11 methyltransferase [Deltaproteobacteria bacterium]